jgi:hypothetical protein
MTLRNSKQNFPFKIPQQEVIYQYCKRCNLEYQQCLQGSIAWLKNKITPTVPTPTVPLVSEPASVLQPSFIVREIRKVRILVYHQTPGAQQILED